MKTRFQKQRGAVLADFLVSFAISLSISSIFLYLIFQLWAYTFVHYESYSLARSSLYGNESFCKAASSLVSLDLIDRSHNCLTAHTVSEFRLLRKLPTTSQPIAVKLR